MEYYSAVKEEHITDMPDWMTLRDMMGERSQMQKSACCVIPFTSNSKTGKTNLRLTQSQKTD